LSPPDLAAFRLPGTGALDGQKVTLVFEDGGALELQITSRDDVVEVAPGAFFIDRGVADQPHEALTVVLSYVTGWALVVHQRRDPSVTGRGPAASHTFSPARIAGQDQSGPAPAPTRDLVGRWHRYRYSPQNLYEHIYVSGERFVSHNVDTQNTGDRADCHPVSYYQVAPDLYVVTWREFDSQASMVMVENLDQLQATGKALHPVSADRSAAIPIGGRILPVQVIFPKEET
jgi:hypothetical protein